MVNGLNYIYIMVHHVAIEKIYLELLGSTFFFFFKLEKNTGGHLIQCRHLTDKDIET